MAENKGFYEVYSYSDKLEEGHEITIKHSISFREERADLSPLVCLSSAALEARRTASMEKEQIIFDKLCTSIAEWEEQAAETMLMGKALEYIRTLPVKHTSNQWRVNSFGAQEISNMVYKMTYSLSEKTRHSRKSQKTVPCGWVVTWSVRLNAPDKKGYYSGGEQIAGQKDKLCEDKASAEKYLQGRMEAYAHLFTEISPPVPEAFIAHFSVNGCLLPGYTAEAHKPTVNELLGCLDDNDFPGISQPEAASREQVESPSPFKRFAGHKKQTNTVKRNTAPTR